MRQFKERADQQIQGPWCRARDLRRGSLRTSLKRAGLELLAVAVALCTWQSRLRSAEIRLYSDNTGAALMTGAMWALRVRHTRRRRVGRATWGVSRV